MTELAATTPPSDTVMFSNVTVVRDQEGNLSFWVGNEKAIGVSAVQIQGGILSLAMQMTRVRLAEDVPATPVVQTANVIEFKNFRKAQLAVDNTTPDAPTTDGESA